MSESRPVCQMIKNSRELIKFSLGDYQGHNFVDMRIFALTGKDDKTIPPRKGLAVSRTLWPEFKKALVQPEEAMIKEGWLDREDLAE
jgi:hypothetical protein